MAVAASSAPTLAQPQMFQRATVLENATLLTGEGRVLENAKVIIRGGQLAGLGTRAETPGNARTTDLAGRFVTAGLIDPNGALALTGGDASPDATARAADAFNAYDRLAVQDAWRNGVTAMFVPARGGLGVLGTGAVVRLAPRERGGFGEMLEGDAALCIDLGSGANAIARAEAFASIIADMRAAELYREAKEIYEEELETYEEKIAERAKQSANGAGSGSGSASGGEGRGSRGRGGSQADGGDGNGGNGGEGGSSEEITKPTQPDPNRAYDVLLRAIDGELPVRVTAHRSSDILNALRLRTQFNLDLVIVGATDADLVAAQIAEAGVAVVLDPVIGPGSLRSPARVHRMRDVASALTRAGVRWSVGSGASSGEASRSVLLAAQEVTDGSADAFTIATRRAAEAIGQQARLGALRPGQAADLVVWSGHPLEPGSFVERVYINGRVVFTSPRSELEGGR
ncbi:MAG: hypothetical protein EA378_07965 [Phycisphaerales bacterium]|nr:MAG: hypothetical protein EA378_07965 [Phycisphaerales bacterium]